ncbi:MAG: hypothetical protein JSV56_11395 [Methanomassiliicoccales archaeon]|nr:MAG: hypothetical protein JSV56_11395 [Methanomassiliicoccales archaeon]
MTTITVNDVERALLNTLGKKGMDKEEVKKLAEYVMNFFGFDDTVSDNLLKARDRDVFYTLQDVGILTTFQDQITIKKGKIWRIHYWVLKKDEILRLANLKENDKKKGEYSIYDEISNDVWSRDEEAE